MADFRKCTRTILLDPVSTFLYWGMNRHIEHHMYAGVPCYNLPALGAAIAADLPEPRTLWASWREMRDAWHRQQEDRGYQYDTPLPASAGRLEDAATGAVPPDELAAAIGDMVLQESGNQEADSGQIDVDFAWWNQGYTWREAEEIRETNPEINLKPGTGLNQWLAVRIDNFDSPWSDVRVRQAAMLAIDHFGVAENVFKGNSRPYYFTSYESHAPWYVSYEELQETRPDLAKLWGYHPDEARALLAEAGYPDGFDTTIYTYPIEQHIAELHQPALREVGIRAEIEVIDGSVYWDFVTKPTPEHAIATDTSGIAQKHPADAWTWHFNPTHNPSPRGGVSWPERTPEEAKRKARAAELWAQYLATPESDPKSVELFKELTILTLEVLPMLPTPTLNDFNAWQPWIVNYGGENASAGPGLLKLMAINADRKREMSGRALNE